MLKFIISRRVVGDVGQENAPLEVSTPGYQLQAQIQSFTSLFLMMFV